MRLDCDGHHSFYCAEVETRTAKTDGDPRLPDSRQGPSGPGACAQARRRVDRMRGRTVAQSFTQHDPSRRIRAARGTELSAKSWQTEAPLRMLMNNLDPEVAERPEDLVVYGGTGRAARSWEAYDATVATLRDLEDDETLLDRKSTRLNSSHVAISY